MPRESLVTTELEKGRIKLAQDEDTSIEHLISRNIRRGRQEAKLFPLCNGKPQSDNIVRLAPRRRSIRKVQMHRRSTTIRRRRIRKV